MFTSLNFPWISPKLYSLFSILNRKSKFSIAYNLSVLSDFSSSYNLSGNNNNGIDSYFLHYADGIPYEDLLIYDDETTQSVYNYLGDNYGFADQQAFLGYQSYIINQSGEDYTNYISNSKYDKDVIDFSASLKDTIIELINKT